MTIMSRQCYSRLVPIIEPDISRDGDHDVSRSLAVSEMVLAEVYSALAKYQVYLEGTVLKPSMVTSGTKCQEQASPDQVAHLTLLGKQEKYFNDPRNKTILQLSPVTFRALFPEFSFCREARLRRWQLTT